MRVTNGMSSKNFSYNLHKNLTRMSKIDEKLNTGKEINRISEDPTKASKIIGLKNDIAKNAQYKKNIIDTTNYLDVTDNALSQFSDGLQSIRELLVSAGNATYGSDERNSIKQEVSEIINKMSDVMNTSFNGKYIFGGERTNQMPIDKSYNRATGNTVLFYRGNNGQATKEELNQMKKNLEVEISTGVKLSYGVNSTELLEFKDKEGTNTNLMDVFTDILNNLDSEDSEDHKLLITNNLEKIDSALKNVLATRGEVGSKQNRMEDALARNEEEKFNIKEILSSLEDIDFAEKTIEYVTASTMYNAALQSSSKIMQPSLLDYLR